MKRKNYAKLLSWKQSELRKPLVFQGARQVGKTYLILEFGKEQYQNVAYFNFEASQELRALFDESMEPAHLLPYLERVSKQTIVPGQTLIVFDEVQTSERALTSLKYWNETHNEYHIIAAGSLLGVAVNRSQFSYPVGKVDNITMHPMDFEEFLVAFDESDLCRSISQHLRTKSKLPVIDHTKLLEYLHKYLAVGGMPECVARYVATENFLLVREAQRNILHDYLADMSKYNTNNENKKTRQVFDSATVQLSKTNSRFQYKLIAKGARAAEFENAIEWLTLSGILSKVNAVEQPWKPLENYKDIDKFKLYVADTGLLCAMKDVDFSDIAYGLDELGDFKGGLMENYACNQLVASDIKPYFWESDNSAEIDFIIKLPGASAEQKTHIAPLEIKAADNTKAKSLRVYIDKYKPELAFKSSTKNFGQTAINDCQVASIPLYALSFLS